MSKTNTKEAKVKIARRDEDFSRWYTDIIAAAEMADYSPVKGCMVIRPTGYAIWENIQKTLDKMFKDTGHENAYFPIFIPEEFIHREAEHVEGFSPELAVVTHAGGKELDEKIVVRPTSETIINDSYSKWVNSWRDLPILINQWANVVRWEMRTRLFLRTTEFLWQEGHTAHETHEESKEEVQKMLNIYKMFVEDYLAIPVLAGIKSDSEKFAGALETYTIEAMMQDKKALQCGTSHDLGQNFAKAFNIRFQDREGELQYAWQTSWGVSTRLIGGMIMVHSDDNGIIIPPRIAPCKAVIVPIWRNDDQMDRVVAKARELAVLLRDFNVKIDTRDNLKPAWKFYEWERKGVPVRIEIGPKDLENNQVVLVRRDNREKQFIAESELKEKLSVTLEKMQQDLFNKALEFRKANTVEIDNYDEFKKFFETTGGFVKTGWCGNSECEAQIKEETAATIRVLIDKPEVSARNCILCNKESKSGAVFARSY
ncbi:MAG: proline--tRNA ligase [Vulcanimicrobiota bacterium]